MKVENNLDETKTAWMGLRKRRQDIDNGLQKNALPQMEAVKSPEGTILRGKIVTTGKP